MPTDGPQDPRQYLNPLERRLFGWRVQRMWAGNTPSFVRMLQHSGPRATAHYAGFTVVRAFGSLAALLALAATVAELSALASVLWLLAVGAVVVCLLLVFATGRAQHAFRRAGRGHG
jgi:hypothetical protein